MATTRIFAIKFQVVKANTPPFSGRSHQYRRDVRNALVSAQNDQGCLAVLTADIPLLAGETIEIVSSSEVSQGTEATVLA